MGLATIVANLGEGLYKIKLRYNRAYLQAELDKLNQLDANYNTILYNALMTLDDLIADKENAREGMNAVLQQYLDGLISKQNEELPPLPPSTPNDPETGLPWDDNDRSWDSELAAAINAFRASNSIPTLATKSDLSFSALQHLRSIATSNHFSIIGSTGDDPATRASWAGYAYDQNIGVSMLLSAGISDPVAVVNQWGKQSAVYSISREILLNADFEDLGTAFKSGSLFYYGYLWGAVFASPGTIVNNTVVNNPAKSSSEAEENILNKQKIPTSEHPKKLDEVCGIFAKASQKVRVAEEEIKKLKSEKMERQRRIALLESYLNQQETIYEAWACQYIDYFAAGDLVWTAEVPGYWDENDTYSTSTIMNSRNDSAHQIPDVTISYTERSINIVPGYIENGQLNFTECMTPSAAFYAAAIEPGHHKWKPSYRYGTIIAKSGGLCTVQLAASKARALANEAEIEIDRPQDLIMNDVAIDYPPCGERLFEEGDEVLVVFRQFDRTKPLIIGFRREPKQCPMGRMSWRGSMPLGV